MSSQYKLSGKSSYMTVLGTQVPITKVTSSGKRSHGDTTDSTSYDAATDMLWEEQIPIKLSQELKIEGRYHILLVPTQVVAWMYSANTAVPCVFGLASGVIHGHGDYDITDLEVADPVDDVVTYSCTLKLNGVFTPGS